VREAPLIELEESWAFGMLWPRRLLVFEDRVEVRGAELLRETVEVVEYGRIQDVAVGGGAAGSTHLLIRAGKGKPLLIRGVDEQLANRAKALIEQRAAHAKNPPQPSYPGRQALIQNLTELRDAGILTHEEFEDKKREVEDREA
jgi:hypothetical protein